MNSVLRSLVLGAIGALATCSVCRADLASCYVFLASDARLDGEAARKATAAIYRAHAQSDHSDQEMLFVLRLHKYDMKQGSYSIGSAELVLGVDHVDRLTGYQVNASDPEGIRNGVAEIEQALKAGLIHSLQFGEREGRRESPLYKQP